MGIRHSSRASDPHLATLLNRTVSLAKSSFTRTHTRSTQRKRFKRRAMNSEYRTGYSSAQLPHRYDHSWRRIPLHISGCICIRKFKKYWGNENHKIEIIDFLTKFYAVSNKTLNVLNDRYWLKRVQTFMRKNVTAFNFNRTQHEEKLKRMECFSKNDK